MQLAAAPTSTCVKPLDSKNMTVMEDWMILRQAAKRCMRPRSRTTRCMIEAAIEKSNLSGKERTYSW